METEKKLAQFVSEAQYADIPQEAIKVIKKIVLNIVGTTTAGSTYEGCQELVDQVREWGGREEATVLIHGGKVPAYNAALVNSYMARALDVDDSMIPGIHPGASTVPAALAAAELVGGCSGKEFLTALALGHETNARLNAVSDYSGFDPTGVCNVFGTAAIAGKILRQNPEQMLDTLALAFNKAGGSFQCNVDGALAVRAIQGFAAQGGIVSAQLAQLGINGPKNFIDGVYGYFHLYARDKYNSEAVTDKLGQKFLFPGIAIFKKHPSCAATEGSTDAILYLMEEKGLTTEDVARIDITVSPPAYRLVGHQFAIGKNPRVNAQFNIQYCTANALLRKKPCLSNFEESQIRDPQIAEIVKKIHVTQDQELEGKVSFDLKTAMKVTTTTGQVYHKVMDAPRGHYDNPLSDEEFQACFQDYVSHGDKALPGENVDRVVSMIGRLEEVEDVRSLVPLVLV